MINLTPHEIVIRTSRGDIVLPPSGIVARVATAEVDAGTFGPEAIPVVRRTLGDVTGMPEAGVPCIVSAMVAAAVPGRASVFAPDTGSTAIRNESGHVVAVTRLVAA